jgi:tetratricopeptide (TPR) repeat protein
VKKPAGGASGAAGNPRAALKQAASGVLLALFLAAPPCAAPLFAAENPALAQSRYRAGAALMTRGDWYAASESFLECLALNPAHAAATASLAECYYELGEFDEALVWARKARMLARSDMALANLEASTLIALGRLDEGGAIIADILRREPYNREGLFAAAELEVAAGKTGDALRRYRDIVRRFPDDRRLLVSLALVSASLGDMAGARNYIDQALLYHPGDYLVCYFAAWLDFRAGRSAEAAARAEEALAIHPGYAPARSLLAALHYREGRYEEAARLADISIARDRADTGAWYLKAMALSRLARPAEAMTVLSTALSIDGDDEFIRAALEDLLIAHTALEDPARERWAAWHFNRAGDFRRRNMNGEALFEYRRGLRLNPYARERLGYAELLRRQGYPSRYLEELRFMEENGLERFSAAERESITDAIENYDALLSETLYRRWDVEPRELASRHWNIAVFSLAGGAVSRHPGAAEKTAALVREFITHDRRIRSLALPVEAASFSAAFRAAREAGADYFLVIGITENERDISLTGDLYVARTGSPASSFNVYRTGADRLRNAARNMVEKLGAALPFRGELVRRRASEALIDRGKTDGVDAGMVFQVVKRGRTATANEGIGLVYRPEDVVGTFTVGRLDEEVSAGMLARGGFYDRVSSGDEILMPPEAGAAGGAESGPPALAVNAELRAFLRTLRRGPPER